MARPVCHEISKQLCAKKILQDANLSIYVDLILETIRILLFYTFSLILSLCLIFNLVKLFKIHYERLCTVNQQRFLIAYFEQIGLHNVA